MTASSTSYQARNPSDSARSAAPLKGKRVLLVEDCPDQQRLFASLLQHAGATVTLECNGQSAVAAAMGSLAPLDAVIMDLAMPVMNGIQATRQLRERGYRGPIIGITAHDSEETQRSWLGAGCDAYLTKPFDRTVLVTAVHRYISTGTKQTTQT